MKIYRIEATALKNGWIDGIINGFRFQAKIYDEDSKFGIENGRVSKLTVWDEQKRKSGSGSGDILSYDRGWDKKPSSSENKDILWALMSYFVVFPTHKYCDELPLCKPFKADVYLNNSNRIKVCIKVYPDI